MRYDADHKEKTHAKLLKAAAKAVRAEGPHRVGVAAVMADAGLTHGGFYAHFASKDALVAAAIGQMFEEARTRFLHETQERTPAQGLIAYIDFYLSAAHRDARRSGCPIAALASDLPRLKKPALEQFADGAARLRAALADKLAQLGHADAQQEASSAMSELVGALSLARVEPDAKRSDAILADSRRALKRRLKLEH
ncbi:MAG TPA: TetR/AcrR family transcriptional regulator [Rudaea sp.]|nr:TetR/AcrR family transcriptional regulator [Rudaea sp.]